MVPPDLTHITVSLSVSSVSTTLEHKNVSSLSQALHGSHSLSLTNITTNTGSKERAQASNTRMHMSCLQFTVSHQQILQHVTSLILITTSNLSRQQCRSVLCCLKQALTEHCLQVADQAAGKNKKQARYQYSDPKHIAAPDF